MEPIQLYIAVAGPNPWKVVIVLEELQLPYKYEVVEYGEIKTPKVTALNPNGRVPVIKDPNNKDIVLWESCAIVEYLVDTYDHDNKLSFPAGSPERFHMRQWMYFQASGQGPYFGQAAWFMMFHEEQLPSAQRRYVNEVSRVASVLDSYLEKHGAAYLVGEKCSAADLVFVPWQELMFGWNQGFDKSAFPHFMQWHGRLMSRPSVQKALKDRETRMAAGH